MDCKYRQRIQIGRRRAKDFEWTTAAIVRRRVLIAQRWVPSDRCKAPVPESPAMLYLAIGILGATVMPHNLYLHSSIVQTRDFQRIMRYLPTSSGRPAAKRKSAVLGCKNCLPPPLVPCGIRTACCGREPGPERPVMQSQVKIAAIRELEAGHVVPTCAGRLEPVGRVRSQ